MPINNLYADNLTKLPFYYRRYVSQRTVFLCVGVWDKTSHSQNARNKGIVGDYFI